MDRREEDVPGGGGRHRPRPAIREPPRSEDPAPPEGERRQRNTEASREGQDVFCRGGPMWPPWVGGLFHGWLFRRGFPPPRAATQGRPYKTSVPHKDRHHGRRRQHDRPIP